MKKFGDPWIFQRTDHYLRTGVLPPPPAFAERVKLVRQHALHLIELFGERHGVIRFRKAGIRYSGVLGLTKVYRRDVSFAKDRAALLAVLDRVADGVYQRPEPRRARGAQSMPTRPRASGVAYLLRTREVRVIMVVWVVWVRVVRVLGLTLLCVLTLLGLIASARTRYKCMLCWCGGVR